MYRQVIICTSEVCGHRTGHGPDVPNWPYCGCRCIVMLGTCLRCCYHFCGVAPLFIFNSEKLLNSSKYVLYFAYLFIIVGLFLANILFMHMYRKHSGWWAICWRAFNQRTACKQTRIIYKLLLNLYFLFFYWCA